MSDTKKGGTMPATSTWYHLEDGYQSVNFPSKKSDPCDVALTSSQGNYSTERPSVLQSHYLDPDSLRPWLPAFEENTQDIPEGYGIEQSYDGGWYPYAIASDPCRVVYLKDERGLDVRCASRELALSVIAAEVLG